ncbi:methyltransferase domain-containing protein [Bradyrhizobium ontarionense]|uniref:Chemotaxis protein methyltransferase n=1 Tax=Bradyrhizobium ontarionense TaxID=2898149 RepID=A0ABY3RI59_9BRAD|nr:CheR family methyltransferase [Bradyrhizobium sp. A19]UFZ07165.1 methyltransferase domain-containing protein [Bradyrhizobium sp. A19]
MNDSALHLTDRHFKSVATLIESQIGIKLPPAKRVMIEGRLQKRVRALKQSSVNEYVERLFEDGQLESELVDLIDCVTTNKTDFFREPSHFEFVRHVAVNELLALRGRTSRLIKIWSAACSTGMEAYTTAMVLDDLQMKRRGFEFRILGTDISTSVLRVAKAGIYPRDMLAPVPAEMAQRYFLSARDRTRADLRVVPELRRRVNFTRMNLMDPSYPVDQDVDIIFCRNVLIYFDKVTQRKVVDRLCRHLRPGGYFLVGHSESMVHQGSVGLKQVQPTIFQNVARR